MSALRQVKKVKGGYEVTVKCTGTPMQTRVFGSYQECEVFADDYFFDYLGVQLKCAHHPVGDGVVPESLNPDSLETIEIEIPMNERLKELAEQSGFQKYFLGSGYIVRDQELERFAELVRQDEREDCAKLCDEEADQSSSDHEAGGMYWCAEAIRARGNHEQTR